MKKFQALINGSVGCSLESWEHMLLSLETKDPRYPCYNSSDSSETLWSPRVLTLCLKCKSGEKYGVHEKFSEEGERLK